MSSQRLIVIESAPARHLAASIRDIWAFRESIRAFAERDVRVKYKQAFLGVLWAVLQPAAYVIIFSLTIGRVADVSTAGVPYAAFSLSTVVPWNFLSNAVSFGSAAVIGNGSMIRRVYFPREVPVFASVASASIDFVIGLALFAIVGPLLGAEVSAWWLFLPVLFVAIVTLATAVATPLAALNVYYRDFRFIAPFVMQLWLFASPVAYPLSVVPEQWRRALRGAQSGGRDPRRVQPGARDGHRPRTGASSASACWRRRCGSRSATGSSSGSSPDFADVI